MDTVDQKLEFPVRPRFSVKKVRKIKTEPQKQTSKMHSEMPAKNLGPNFRTTISTTQT